MGECKGKLVMGRTYALEVCFGNPRAIIDNFDRLETIVFESNLYYGVNLSSPVLQMSRNEGYLYS